jgi:2'-5' RNA ligase
MRLFFGVPVDEAVRERVAELQQRLKAGAGKVSWEQPAKFHFTLRFLGEMPEERVPKVAEAADGVWAAARPGQVVLRGIGAFPTPRSPRVIWVGVGKGAEVIGGLEQALSAALEEAIRFPREKRGYAPHLTIGRVRVPRRDPGLEAAIAELADAEAGQFDVSQFVLYQSILGPGGSVYRVMRLYDA